jgi:hypothetical protein
VQSLPTWAKDVEINVQRTVSRLSTVFITLYKHLKPIDSTYSSSKFWNTFYNPLAKHASLRVDDNDEMQFSEYRRQGYP